jgi:tripartite-type tricarboxylate transporter receptor subunit TctC
MALTPEQATKFISSETAKWREIIQKANIPMIE